MKEGILLTICWWLSEVIRKSNHCRHTATLQKSRHFVLSSSVPSSQRKQWQFWMVRKWQCTYLRELLSGLSFHLFLSWCHCWLTHSLVTSLGECALCLTLDYDSGISSCFKELLWRKTVHKQFKHSLQTLSRTASISLLRNSLLRGATKMNGNHENPLCRYRIWMYIHIYIYARYSAEHSVRLKIICFSVTVCMYVWKALQTKFMHLEKCPLSTQLFCCNKSAGTRFLHAEKPPLYCIGHILWDYQKGLCWT